MRQEKRQSQELGSHQELMRMYARQGTLWTLPSVPLGCSHLGLEVDVSRHGFYEFALLCGPSPEVVHVTVTKPTLKPKKKLLPPSRKEQQGVIEHIHEAREF
jgi:hypothetical protein